MNIKHVSLIVVSGVGFCVGSAQAEPFVFQGQLNDSGAPADGIYDLEFGLFDLDLGGGQIGSTITLEDQTVTNGNFLVELDFGDVFDGSTRWIETGVRNGDTVDPFTTLAPRMKVGSTPQASYATTAGVANSVADQFWTQAPGIVTFGEDEGHDQFFFNRDRVVDPTDVMVVHSAMPGPGGIMLSSWSNGMPYYAFATGGVTRAKTYYDPATDAWVVNKGGSDQIEVDQNNDVIITNNLIVGGTILSGDGSGTNTQYKSYTPESIFAGFDFARVFNSFAGAIVTQGSSSYLRADIDLPHGATITNITMKYVDRGSNNLRVQLWERDMNSILYSSQTLATTSGADLTNVRTLSINPDPAIVIDNINTTYQLRCFATLGAWPTNGNLGVRNILIEYTMP